MPLSSVIIQLIKLIRYRFFLFAGIIPYVLGQAMAFSAKRLLDWHKFYLGLLGIFFALIGVELFNEYFDAKEGGDRIFSRDLHNIPQYFYILGISVFLIAFAIGVYLALQAGWLIIIFCLLGFLAAYFYVGPPLKWAYRGWGEIVIAFSYGPLMLLGSYYLQIHRIDSPAVLASLICSLTIFCLAIVNEIPDYYQDKLVGKRNLVVKLGRQKAMKLLVMIFSCIFFLLAAGIILKKLPLPAIFVFLAVPWVSKSLNAAHKDYDNPKAYLSAINTNVVIYLMIAFFLTLGYIIPRN